MEDKNDKIIEKAKAYNLDGLRNESTSFLYKLRLAQKLKEEISGTTEVIYEKLKEKLHNAASEALGITERRSKHFWWTDELTGIVEEKKRLYLKWLTTNDVEDCKQYNHYKYIVKKEIRKVKNSAWDNKCTQINSMMGGSRSREAWKTINSLRRTTNEAKKINPIGITIWKDY